MMPPINPNGYKEFGKAKTRLSDKELENMVNQVRTMTQQQLDSLVGLDLKNAEAIVRSNNFDPYSLEYGTITTALALPKEMVRLWIKNGKVVLAETQDSIDSKYASKK